ncbi:phage antirepressor N-terminal domain-containing protein [Pseudomonas alliivorans]|nr:phage antirepressor N-terminal domain-containing protein [Pseudomonas alliivorans]MEE5171603.1 phage antirepressor N-terminal domain-containing protein [Pseudomonas alliivorans]
MTKQLKTTPIKVNYRSTTLIIIEKENVPYVAMQPVVEALGMSWRHQKTRLKAGNLSSDLTSINLASIGKNKRSPTVCIPLIKFHSWLTGLTQKRITARLRDALSAWQEDCVDQLWFSWNKAHANSEIDNATVNALYHGKRFRFRRIGNEQWYAASDVVVALGLRSTPHLLKALPQSARIKLQIGRQHLHAINQAGLEQACLMAPPLGSEHLRIWLSKLQHDSSFDGSSPTLSICKDSADATLDYLSRSRQSLRDAGAEMVEWDEALAQRIANSAASMLIRNRRWLLTLNDHGEPHLSVIPRDAGVFTSDELVRWVRDPAGARSELLSRLLSAIGERLAGCKD